MILLNIHLFHLQLNKKVAADIRNIELNFFQTTKLLYFIGIVFPLCVYYYKTCYYFALVWKLVLRVLQHQSGRGANKNCGKNYQVFARFYACALNSDVIVQGFYQKYVNTLFFFLQYAFWKLVYSNRKTTDWLFVRVSLKVT